MVKKLPTFVHKPLIVDWELKLKILLSEFK